jgi:uncharacterized membrane protein
MKYVHSADIKVALIVSELPELSLRLRIHCINFIIVVLILVIPSFRCLLWRVLILLSIWVRRFLLVQLGFWSYCLCFCLLLDQWFLLAFLALILFELVIEVIF